MTGVNAHATSDVSLAEATQVKDKSSGRQREQPATVTTATALMEMTLAKTMASSESVTLPEQAPVYHKPNYAVKNELKKNDEIRNVVQIFDNDIATSRAINIRDSLSTN